MKIKNHVCVLLILIIIAIAFAFSNTSASNTLIHSYDFYISQDNTIIQNNINMTLADSVDEKTLINGKTAPGTQGSFQINVNIQNDIVSKYTINFDNLSCNIPKNLKFYYNNEEIDLTSFFITDIKSTSQTSYLFNWVWEYEADNDIDDTKSSSLGKINFDIILVNETDSIIINNINNKDKLPRSGDIERRNYL